jgi:homoserine kinase type II
VSVFTPVAPEALAAWLARYPVGRLTALAPIAQGIENTNYFVDTERGRYVLTLYERLPREELPYYLDLMAHLAGAGMPCPRPLVDGEGRRLGTLYGRPAALLTRLPGASVDSPAAAHCAAAGAALAALHLAARTFPQRCEHPRGVHWRRRTAAALLPLLPDDERRLLEDELRFQALFALEDLPRGVIHADLFRDNVLFGEAEGTPRVEGVLDFYFAGEDSLLFDLAVACNDWCIAPDAALDAERVGAMLAAYHAVRPLTALERGAWPVLLRAAALRFWLSRLDDRHHPRPGAMVLCKDPAQYRDILQLRRAARSDLPWLE